MRVLYLIEAACFVGLALLAGLLLFFAGANGSIERAFCIRLAMVLAYCIVISFISPDPLICNIMASFTVPLFAREPNEIAPVYIFSFLILPTIGVPLTIGGPWSMTIDTMMSVTVGAAVMTTIRERGGGQRSWTIPGICLLAILTIYILSGIRATPPANILHVLVEQLCIIALPFYAVRRAIRTGDDVRRIFIATVAATAALSTLAIYEAWTTWPLYRAVYDHYGILPGGGAALKMRGSLLRSPGPFSEPASFAYWLSIGTFVALVSRWMFRSTAAHLATGGLLLLGLYAPQSRGAWLGLLVACLVYQARKRRVPPILKGVAVAIVLGGLIYGAALAIPPVAQTIGLDAARLAQRDDRQDLLMRGIGEARHNLLIGTDIDTMMTSLADRRQRGGAVDLANTYLYVLLVSGLVGLAAFAGGLLVPVVVLWRRAGMLRRHDTRQLSVIAALLGSIAVMLASTSLVGRSAMGLGVMLGVAAALSRMRPANMTTRKRASHRPKDRDADHAGSPGDPAAELAV